MKKGERSLFTLPADLACGEALFPHFPPTMPHKGTIQFDVELLSWTSVKCENPKDLDEVLGECLCYC